MLDASEIEYIRCHAWTADHDYFVQQAVLGEPLLQDELLHFCDGETLFVATNALTGTRCDIRLFLEKRLNELHPKRVNCWGANLDSLDFLGSYGFQPVYEVGRDPWNQELVVDFERSERRLARRFKEVLRQSRRQAIVCTYRRSGPLAADHIKLLRTFIADLTSELDSFDLVQFLSVPGLLANSEVSSMIEARQDGRLVGFIQGHGALGRRFAILALCVFEKGCTAVCDILYANILRHFKESGFRACSLGTTIRQGLYLFKAKWGGEPITGGYSQAIWETSGNESSIHCYHWLSAVAGRYFGFLHQNGIRFWTPSSIAAE
jgi:hypothetical protein